MRIGVTRALIVAAIGVVGFAGCSIVPKLDDSSASNNAVPETTGSIARPPAAPAFAPTPPPAQFGAFWGVAY
jgi:hypothetical protein